MKETERERLREELEEYRRESEDMGISLQEYLLLRILSEIQLQ